MAEGVRKLRQRSPLARAVYRHRFFYVMLIPGVIYYLIFRYLPIWGILMGFTDYRPSISFFDAKWVGLEQFQRIFDSGALGMLFKNTLIISTLNLVFYFPIPILLALLLNEVKCRPFKKAVQSSIYIPYFISWVVVASIATMLLNVENGLVNQLLIAMGKAPADFMASTTWFRPIILIEMIWRESGYGTIIFLAALSGIDPSLYEAATIDGANRWQKMIHITLTGIKSTIVVMLLLRLGTFFELGFDQIFLQLNAMNRSVGEIFDTYIYRVGIQNGDYAYTTAIGLFKSVTGLILVLSANKFAKKMGEEGIF